MGQKISFALDEGAYISQVASGLSRLKNRRKKLHISSINRDDSPPPVSARTSSLFNHEKDDCEYAEAYEEILTVPFFPSNCEYIDKNEPSTYLRPRSVIDINLRLINTR